MAGIPEVIDIDPEHKMIMQSKNPSKMVANPSNIPLNDESITCVEMSSFCPSSIPGAQQKIYESLKEAHRVLAQSGVLLLTSAAKLFGECFEDGLKRLGFNIITPVNTRLGLDEAALDTIDEWMNEKVLQKAKNAMRNTYYAVAVKSERPPEEVDPTDFVFQKLQETTKQEMRPIGTVVRQFGGKMKRWQLQDVDALQSLVAVMNTFDEFAPHTHAQHSDIIQQALLVLALATKEERSEHMQLKSTQLEKVQRIIDDLPNELGKGQLGDKYFLILREAAKLHRRRLRMVEMVGKKQIRELNGRP